MKRYEIRIFIIITCIIILSSCSPSHRFVCLITKHPYLLETLQSDTIRVCDTISQDTQFLWKKEVDTLVFREVTIERRRDTFRIIKEARPCTTFIRRTEYRPSKIIEKYVTEKRQKRSFFQGIKDYFLYCLLFVLIIVLIIRK